ncbi:MAG: hypothetical protein R3D28_02190 [Geminicoccaceae bacterium]
MATSSAWVLRSTTRLLVHDDDLVGVGDGGEAMRDDQRGAALGGARGRGPSCRARFGGAVEGRGRLVEDQDRRRFSITRAMATRCFSPPELSGRARRPSSGSRPAAFDEVVDLGEAGGVLDGFQRRLGRQV